MNFYLLYGTDTSIIGREIDIIKEKLNDLYTLLVVSLVIVLIVVYAMPKFADKEQKIVENKLATTFGYGALALILVPFVCLLLFCTILGTSSCTFPCLLIYNYASCNSISSNCYG